MHLSQVKWEGSLFKTTTFKQLAFLWQLVRGAPDRSLSNLGSVRFWLSNIQNLRR